MKPILFNTEMVKGILDGRKTVTRRVIKLKYSNTHIEWRTDKYGTSLVELQNDIEGETHGTREDGTTWRKLLGYREIVPPYHKGQTLYVRETWFYEQHMEDATFGNPDLPSGRYSHRYVYRADNPDYPVDVGVGAHGWRPSIHMPREAARIFLRVTDVRVERLQNITPDDAIREGIIKAPFYEWRLMARSEFEDLWNNTIPKKDIGKYGWDADPWVWVIEFEPCEKPEGGDV